MNLLGHERQIKILTGSLKSRKLLNGYIFSGKEGIGKNLTAQNFAKSILCAKSNFFEFCDCEECKFGETHPDLRVINETPIKIDMIRELAEYAQMTPFRGRYKVCIINNAHEMGIEAANAFLKTLEEPGEGTVFILVTHRYEKIIPTMRSRCVKIDFSRLSDVDIISILKEKQINNIDEKVIKAASGSISVAMSLLEKQSQAVVLSVPLLKDKEGITKYILGMKNKDEVRDAIMEIYRLTLDSYLNIQNPILLDFSNYLLEISRRLDYNVNFDIFKSDLISKIIGVLSEEI